MCLHILPLLKLKLLASTSYFTVSPFTAASLLFFFSIPLNARHFAAACRRATAASRWFLFRLSVIMFEEDEEEDGVYNQQRWERAVRLVTERVATGRRGWSNDVDEHTLHAATMIAL